MDKIRRPSYFISFWYIYFSLQIAVLFFYTGQTYTDIYQKLCYPNCSYYIERQENKSILYHKKDKDTFETEIDTQRYFIGKTYRYIENSSKVRTDTLHIEKHIDTYRKTDKQ